MTLPWHFIETDDPLEIQVKHSANEPRLLSVCVASREIYSMLSRFLGAGGEAL